MALIAFSSLSREHRAYCKHRGVFPHPKRWQLDMLRVMIDNLREVISGDVFMQSIHYYSEGESTLWEFECEHKQDLTVIAMIFQKHSKLDQERVGA